LTPARMVELIRSRAVLAGVGFSTIKPGGQERIIDRVLGKKYDQNDAEQVAKQLAKGLTTETNKETGTIDVAVQHPDSALARLVAQRVVDSASQIFVRTSKARSEEHTSELQSPCNLVCRLLLDKKNNNSLHFCIHTF